ncbi:uncharacterized protein MYCGRDRAFT_97804 [Zymoseptoria tritici IPO323]|uniref:Uncharacterized protein n=1 Tax=Zymoseptoria tritici (strain CBS 115943 / IPO323) TaxID=336722 RepID=F9XRF3_ZYMTI|nr:uncharacterized protein MYCGRDRAFT_97804 [Zymoseptoria tritici IPO323]EGP82176.1 hypothetical protein MYCGRDRAFT_97804 [Zymoseptoria tritici IPO323]
MDSWSKTMFVCETASRAEPRSTKISLTDNRICLIHPPWNVSCRNRNIPTNASQATASASHPDRKNASLPCRPRYLTPPYLEADTLHGGEVGGEARARQDDEGRREDDGEWSGTNFQPAFELYVWNPEASPLFSLPVTFRTCLELLHNALYWSFGMRSHGIIRPQSPTKDEMALMRGYGGQSYEPPDPVEKRARKDFLAIRSPDLDGNILQAYDDLLQAY